MSNTSRSQIPFDERLRALLDASSDAVFIAAFQGPILHANPCACRIFGYTLEEARTLYRTDVFVDDARTQRAFRTRLRDGALKATLPVRRKSGELFEAEVAAAEVIGEHGERQLVVLIHDTSERERADEAVRALKASEETFRALSDATFESIFLHRDGKILLTNAAAERTFGVGPKGLIGKSLLDCAAPQARELVARRIQERNDDPFETFALRADNTVFPAEAQSRTTFHYRGEPARVTAVRDVTRRKRLEASLALADRMATIGTMAAGIAHEINNPLAALTLNLELALARLGALQGDEARAEIERAVTEAHESAQRVQRIVRDLKSLSRPADDGPGPTDLREVIDYVGSVARFEVRHRARLTIDITEEAPLVAGSKSRVEQILLNLLVNAAHAIPDDGCEHGIGIRVSAHGDEHVAVEVSDTGAGIPPELGARIFEPFVTTKPVGVGTGLGLSISKDLLTSLGGEIEVRSEVGVGTTFRVLFRRSTSPLAAVTPDEPSVARPRRAARVLFIDDEPRIGEAVVHLLEEHQVTVARSAEEALGLLERGERYDVVFCDLMMPGMTGADFHEAVSRRWPEVVDRLVVVTGGAVTARAADLLSRLSTPALEKPFTIEALEARVEDVLSRTS